MPKWNPGRYAKASTHQQTWARETLASVRLEGVENILDVGCGDGKVTAALSSQTSGRVVGIDKSAEMVSYAREHHESGARGNLFFEIGEAESFRVVDPFDIITSFSALHWVADHPRMLKNFYSLLRPGGRLVLQFGGKNNAADIINVALKMIASKRWSSYYTEFKFPWHFHGPLEYRDWLITAGFSPLSVELVPKDMIHEGLPELTAWIETTWLPFLEALPEVERGVFVKAVAHAYEKNYPPDAQGRLHTKMFRLQILAERPVA